MKIQKKILFSMIASLILINSSCNKEDDPINDQAENVTMNFQDQVDIADEMLVLYEELLLQNSAEISRVLLVEELNNFEDIKAAGITEDATTVWWEYKDGLDYYFLTETSLSITDSLTNSIIKKPSFSKMNGPIIVPANKRALVLSPFYWQFRLWPFGTEESDHIASVLEGINYNVDYKYNYQPFQYNISLEDYKNFANYSVIAISTHGGIDEVGQNIINSGVPITEENTAYVDDEEARNRIGVMCARRIPGTDFGGLKAIGLKSSWFDHIYNTKLNQTLVYMGACKSYSSTRRSLANALLGNESAFFGFNKNAGIPFARRASSVLFNYLATGKTVEDAYTLLVLTGNGEQDGIELLKSSNSYNDLALIGDDIFSDAAAVKAILQANGIDVSDPRWVSSDEIDIVNVLADSVSGISFSNESNGIRIYHLIITDFDLSIIPEEVGNLIFLNTLYLGNNQITNIPETIGNLSNLVDLNFSNNQITNIPETIGNLSNLVDLSFRYNQITNIPEEISKLTTNLTQLRFMGNQLTSVPSSLGNLINLRLLELQDNQLINVPSSLGNLINLNHFSVNDNPTLTCLPQEIWDLTDLGILVYFSDTAIEGPGDTDCN